MIGNRTIGANLLDRPVLVLNRLWQAINVCSVRRAIPLLCTGHAQVVDEEDATFSTYGFDEWSTVTAGDESEFIHSVKLRIRCPRIIVLGRFDRLPNKEVRYTRTNVFSRDKHTCQYCRQRFERRYLNIDHVVPRHRGGKTVWTNVVCCCLECNRLKGNRTPEEAGMHLMHPPKKPRWQPFLEVQFSKAYDQSWHHFLNFDSWKVDMGET